MRVKRDIGESVLLKLPIYYITINTCACIESPHYLERPVVCFPKVIKRFTPYYNVLRVL